MNIPYNKPYITGREQTLIKEVLENGHISGNGTFTRACHDFFVSRYGFGKCLLTTSGTDALEMAAILLNLGNGDEVIMPSYTFVSTANAFVLRGAKIVFADSMPHHPNIDVSKLEDLITERTRAIVVVHYAGTACDMDAVLKIADKHNLVVIEDAAQAIDSFYKGKPLGGSGHMAAFSFHETKNVISGEGGMLVINDPGYFQRAEIIWEKGTNRAAYFRGEVDKYGWVDIGSSFLPSEITAAFLAAQLEKIDFIRERRMSIWKKYFSYLRELEDEGLLSLPEIPEYADHNAHIFYVLLPDAEKRHSLIKYLKQAGIMAVFHYNSLHRSKFYQDLHDGRQLPFSDRFSDCLLRLPLFADLHEEQIVYITLKIKEALRQ